MHNKAISSLKLFPTNAAGVVTGKADSLNNKVKATGSNIVTIQGTHSLQKGKIKLMIALWFLKPYKKPNMVAQYVQ